MACMLSLQSCLILCHSMDSSPTGSSVHELFQARILEWVAMPFSKGSSPPQGSNSCLLPSSLMSLALAARLCTLAPPGEPRITGVPI